MQTTYAADKRKIYAYCFSWSNMIFDYFCAMLIYFSIFGANVKITIKMLRTSDHVAR